MMLVIGANGQLGQCFQQAALSCPDITFQFKSSAELDITRFAAVSKTIQSLAAQYPKLWVINCAAYTAVDKAESEPDQARRVNVQGVRNLARICASLELPLVHFSTDYVYHSKQNTPFIETDSVHPVGVYAKTKLAGERAALQQHPTKTMVIRTSWVYSGFGNNFVKTMLRLGAERPMLRVVWDQIGSPTYAPDLADAVIQIYDQVTTGKMAVESIGGIWHYANEGVASWYDLADAVFEYEQLGCKLEPITTQEYPTPARRPPFSVLDKSKIKSAFGLEIPHWRTSLQKCLKAIKATSAH
ncbi:MAG TPA: dTDP-4-dehydrorhamnose reductase [Saprospiraceae bacterium]|nr:dTDP-4-dehydrorhamnose reductase [Saprospiraceae bacterium]